MNYPVTAQSLFSPSDTPAIEANDPSSVNFGVEFQASTNGTITGIRFYKSPLDTGTHVADLWSANGTLLATATFTNETASGWQQVNLSSPVVVTAGTTYVVSYRTSGNYSETSNYFATSDTNGELTALANGGVYAYGTGSVPHQQLQRQQLLGRCRLQWITEPATGCQNVSGLVDPMNTTLSIPASTLLANDTDLRVYRCRSRG